MENTINQKKARRVILIQESSQQKQNYKAKKNFLERKPFHDDKNFNLTEG